MYKKLNFPVQKACDYSKINTAQKCKIHILKFKTIKKTISMKNIRPLSQLVPA